MSKPVQLLLVAGARPNFVKIAPIIHEILRRPTEAGYRLLHTGQHYDERMSSVFFQELDIPSPHVNLGVGSGTHAAQTARVMESFEPVCQELRPDWVVVVGDVNSTMACTLVCAKLGVRVAHVEAGLRSFDRQMPEEINRIITDALADLLLTPSADGDENLLKEGVPASKIRRVGNVMIDSLVANLPQARSCGVLGRLALQEKGFAYVTLHRPANVDHQPTLAALVQALGRLSHQLPVVFAVHPRTAQRCRRFGIDLAGSEGLRTIEPVGYHESLRLTEAAAFVLTDSGGLQEESTFFRTPCLTLRLNTERPITLSVGSNRLTTLDRFDVDVAHALAHRHGLGSVPPLWDGKTSSRIIDCLIEAS